MSTSVIGPYSPEPSHEMSPETLSPIYPDRPIRPLPKRRLRERLSPDVAESIKYPPAPPTTTPLFYYPYSLGGDDERTRDGRYALDRQRSDVEYNYISRRNNAPEVDSDDEYPEPSQRSRFTRQNADATGRSYRYVQKPEPSKYPKPEPPASTTSSADGYDSFENTNNKKKRKIPTPGEAGLNGMHLSNDLASLGISSPEDAVPPDDVGASVGHYYGSGGSASSASSQGLSGPGRGRYGRTRNGRSPLRTLSDAPNNWSNGRTTKQRPPQWSTHDESSGIISTAIANAEKLSPNSSKGQENVSLLQEQASKKSSPASTQFTFTCDSQVPGTVAWPGPQSTQGGPNQSPTSRPISHATQTMPKPPIPAGQQPPGQQAANASKQNARPPAAPKKPRRRPGREYLIAARQRREQQEFQNYHHPPSPEDEWICEFCEYERIFGVPPEALIRQYEIKDMRVRKAEAERRRLLEKAKMKGRKGKKNNKMAAKNAAANNQQAQHQHAQHQSSMTHSHSQDTQSEEYYEDEYDDDYINDEPPPSPTMHPAPRRQDLEGHDLKKYPSGQGIPGSEIPAA